RAHDLVCARIGEHAVLVDAGLVRERVDADNGLVAHYRRAGEGAEQAASGDQFRGVDSRVHAVEVAARLERHDDLFQRAIAGSLANTIDGDFDLARAAGDG